MDTDTRASAIEAATIDRETTDGVVSLDEALINARKHIHAAGGVGKSGEYNAPGTRYSYRTVDDLVNAVAEATVAAGVNIMITSTDIHQEWSVNAKGQNVDCIRLTATYMVTAVGCGEVRTGVAVGAARDNADKALSKAKAMLRKDMYADGLTIPLKVEGETDPDAERTEAVPPVVAETLRRVNAMTNEALEDPSVSEKIVASLRGEYKTASKWAKYSVTCVPPGGGVEVTMTLGDYITAAANSVSKGL